MLAIVIPYFKIRFFEETLSSLAKQTDKRFRVYIGDDASPEDPSAVLDQYKEKINLEYKRFDKNLGGNFLTKHWERCLEMVRDESWIMILCDDDILSENVVEAFYLNHNEIIDSGSKVVRFATQEIDGAGEKISRKFQYPKLQDYSDSFYERFLLGSRSSLSEYIFSKKSYIKHGFEPLRYAWHADDLAWLQFSEFGFIFSINEALVYFRLSNHNISRHGYREKEKKEIRYEFFTIIVDRYIEKFKVEHRKKILKKYELMTYEMGRGDISFWKAFLPLVNHYQGFWESLKFTRRIYLNYGK